MNDLQRAALDAEPDRKGMLCIHGKWVMVTDPNDHSRYPAHMFAEPYPCPQPECSRAEIEREFEEEAIEYERDRWREYYDLIGPA